MRICPRCKVPKPLDEFVLRRRVIKSGVRYYPSYCHPCDNAYQRECYAKKLKPPKQPVVRFCRKCGSSETINDRWICQPCRKKQQREDYDRNKIRRLEVSKKWRENNPQKHKDAMARWEKEHRSYRKEWREQHLEHRREIDRNSAKRCRKKTKPQRMHYQRMRKARMNGATGSCSLQQWKWRLAFYGWRCLYCEKPLTIETATRDHKIPVSAPKSYNWPSNLVPACKNCNASRHAIPFLSFLARWRHIPKVARDSKCTH